MTCHAINSNGIEETNHCPSFTLLPIYAFFLHRSFILDSSGYAKPQHLFTDGKYYKNNVQIVVDSKIDEGKFMCRNAYEECHLV